MNKCNCFVLTVNGKYKSIIPPVSKGEDSQKGDRNVKQASLLIQNSYRRLICARIIFRKYTSATCCRRGAKKVLFKSVNISMYNTKMGPTYLYHFMQITL